MGDMYNSERSICSMEPRSLLNHMESDKTVTNMSRSLYQSIVFRPGSKFTGTLRRFTGKYEKYSMRSRYLLWTNQIAVLQL